MQEEGPSIPRRSTGAQRLSLAGGSPEAAHRVHPSTCVPSRSLPQVEGWKQTDFPLPCPSRHPEHGFRQPLSPLPWGARLGVRAPRSPHLCSPPQRTPQPGPPPVALVSQQHRNPCACPVSFPSPSQGESSPFPWQGRQKSRQESRQESRLRGAPAVPLPARVTACIVPRRSRFLEGNPAGFLCCPRNSALLKEEGFGLRFPPPDSWLG